MSNFAVLAAEFLAAHEASPDYRRSGIGSAKTFGGGVFRPIRCKILAAHMKHSHTLSSTLANFAWPNVPNLQVFPARLEFLTVPGTPGTVKKFARSSILQHFVHWRLQKLAKVELRSRAFRAASGLGLR